MDENQESMKTKPKKHYNRWRTLKICKFCQEEFYSRELAMRHTIKKHFDEVFTVEYVKRNENEDS